MTYQVEQSSRTTIVLWTIQVIVLAASVLTGVSANGAGFSQKQKITSTPRGAGAQFGHAIAVSGNTMIVGARFDSTTAAQAGAAYVFVLSGDTWTQQAQLLASDGAAFDKFGQSVAISGDTIVVGAYQANAPLSNNGAAYVFVRSGTTWTQQQKLTASDGTADDEFGNAVAIKGDSIVVGSHFADFGGNSSGGSAYLFRRTGTVWSETQKLIPVGATLGGDLFGESIAISGDKLVVGSPGADTPQTSAGAVFVYVELGSMYNFQQKLSIPDGTNGDNFGNSVAIDGNTIVCGAREDTPVTGQTAAGSAYVFQFDGTNWNQQQKLVASDAALSDRFGWSVAVRNNTVAVGAREDDTSVGPDAGSVYVFTRSTTSWAEQQKLTPGDPFNIDRFGVSVTFATTSLVIGAAEKNLTSPNGQGAAYVFSGSQPAKTFPDFDGDGKADVSIFRPGNGQWWTRLSSGGTRTIQFGSGNDLQAPGDYDGDGKTDESVYRPGTGAWFVLFSGNSTSSSINLGTAGDVPLPGDFDGDGKSDRCVFRPSSGQWIRLNSSDGQTVTVTMGAAGDIPLIGDFDGDGKSDPSTWRPATATFNILRSSNGATLSFQLGVSNDFPAPADYDGDGITDLAVFSTSGVWTIQKSGGGTQITSFGTNVDRPAPADYDGDAKADLAVFRESEANWFFSLSSGITATLPWGNPYDEPVPLFFVRHSLPQNTVQFSAANYTVTEDPTTVEITVTRSGDLNRIVAVSYATSDGSAKQASDYTVAVGVLTFGFGESSKTFKIAITEDAIVEGTETATLTLINPIGGVTLGTQSTATFTILDDVAEPSTNPNDIAGTFVSQHYFDFLNREADPGGQAFWTGEISGCGSDLQCTEVKRINVSAAFYLSIEFQETGYLVYRFYNAALNRPNNLVRYLEFLKDTQKVGLGVVVGTAGWESKLEANKIALASEFVERPEFVALYPISQTPAQFVDALYSHAGIVPTVSERQAAINEFSNINGARGRVLRRVAENQTLTQREFNRAFVLMQYFGYLRRNPDDAPDSDLAGFNFWLGKLNQFNGNFVQAEMVKAFLSSIEYRRRFAN